MRCKSLQALASFAVTAAAAACFAAPTSQPVEQSAPRPAFQPAPPSSSLKRQMEHLGSGTAVLHCADNKAFVSWRMLGTDPDAIAYNVYRQTGAGQPQKLNDQPISAVTYFVDSAADFTQPLKYSVRPVVSGVEGPPGSTPLSALPANSPVRPYFSIPIQTPPGYAANDASVGDLDGDGEYELVVHFTGRTHDNSQSGETDPPILKAYRLDGTCLWTINLGRNIRDGAHYTQFLVYDFDGDGRAEMICKTADGTIDGAGKVIGDASANHVNSGGHVLKGPEFLTVFDGRTGAALDTVKYVPARTDNHPEDPDLDEYNRLWGDKYGNRGERYLAAVAYLDGQRPSALFCRGYYTRTVIAAWDFTKGHLSQHWVFDTGHDFKNPFAGQGNHNLSIADVNGDGKDDILYGGMCVDSSGKGLWSTGYGHGDAIHVGHLDPTLPGLQMFRIQERFDDAGAHMVDLATGKTLWKKPSLEKQTGGKKVEGPGRGLAADIDPRYPGAECWALGSGVTGLWDAKGNVICDHCPSTERGGKLNPTCNFRVYWDSDLLDELLDGTHVLKYDYEHQLCHAILTADDCRANNSTKATPTLSADILGDWREEIIWPTTDGKELRLYLSTLPTDYRFYTLMHDPQYRLSVAWQNVGYNQPPHISWSLATEKPPKPNISLVEPHPATSSIH